jgi:pSer/pThr/pTyr-binding forkhead associated (FHA) protein
MIARVTLTVKEGLQRGRRFVVDRPGKSVIGRTDDCSVHLSGGLDYQLVSRHHCLLDIDLPEVRVHDLGSLNGTYVNGRLIGRRPSRETAEDATETIDPGCPLADGDELRLGPVVFGIRLDIPGGHAKKIAPAPRMGEPAWPGEGGFLGQEGL